MGYARECDDKREQQNRPHCKNGGNTRRMVLFRRKGYAVGYL
jgi:hypothetical protein